MPDGGRIARTARPVDDAKPEHPAVTEYRMLTEQLRRRECRRSFLAWCIEALAPFGQTPAAHHRLLIAELQAVADGAVDRLMVLMPPGSAKSFYATRMFAAWMLARRKGMKLIGASHTAELADDFSGKIHDVITENTEMLGYGLRTKALGRWQTTNGGEYLSVGVRGAVAGIRADHVTIDDPVKSRAAADSPADRKLVWDWFNGDLERRLTPRASIALVMTPWHEADLAGELLRTEPERWRVVRLPAEAEANDMLGRAPGEWLWSDDSYGYGAELAGIKAALSARGAAREWSSQYQGRPVPDSGDYFRRDWLRAVPSLPPRSALRVFGASDYAVTDDGGDFTVHIVVGVDSDDRLYVLDLWRGQTSSDQWVEAFCDLVIRCHPMGWAEETGQIRAGIGPWLDRRSRERRAFVARQTFPTRGDKSVRAQSIRGRMALNGLYVAADAPWRADFEAELLSFPAGKHDDVPDALGLIGMLLDVLLPPPPKGAEPPRDSWDAAFRRSRGEDDTGGWRVA
jgi:predicted phage terminase large subunit-like protein